MSKVYQHTDLFWIVFSHIRTQSTFLSLYGKIRVRENSSSGILCAVGIDHDCTSWWYWLKLCYCNCLWFLSISSFWSKICWSRQYFGSLFYEFHILLKYFLSQGRFWKQIHFSRLCEENISLEREFFLHILTALRGANLTNVK